MNNPIPSKPGVINNDMDLPSTKLCCFLHQRVNILGVEHVARDCDCSLVIIVVAVSFVDGFDDGFSFFYYQRPTSVPVEISKSAFVVCDDVSVTLFLTPILGEEKR